MTNRQSHTCLQADYLYKLINLKVYLAEVDNNYHRRWQPQKRGKNKILRNCVFNLNKKIKQFSLRLISRWLSIKFLKQEGSERGERGTAFFAPHFSFERLPQYFRKRTSPSSKVEIFSKSEIRKFSFIEGATDVYSGENLNVQNNEVPFFCERN